MKTRLFKHTRAPIHLFCQSARKLQKKGTFLLLILLFLLSSLTCQYLLAHHVKKGGKWGEGYEKKVATQTRRHTSHFFTFLRNRHLCLVPQARPLFKRIFPNWLGKLGTRRQKMVYFFSCVDVVVSSSLLEMKGKKTDWGRLSSTFYRLIKNINK